MGKQNERVTEKLKRIELVEKQMCWLKVKRDGKKGLEKFIDRLGWKSIRIEWVEKQTDRFR